MRDPSSIEMDDIHDPQPDTSVDRRLQRKRSQRHVRQHLVGNRLFQLFPERLKPMIQGESPNKEVSGSALAPVFHVDRRPRDGLVVVLP
ncbi:unnamed protein product [Macrosiphum euphorbiae]|uniref:Uncharacterized protein n=1 Tax=Macrosiphum euphorbiae TaxID=13131 RepID=A0AAV0YAE2_9HEMI|nr:unnamed protein product [Macrosiphum euphorbiae]